MKLCKGLVLTVLLLQLGCSTFENLSTYRNSTLSNLNPAPANMSPPEGSVIDHSQMQATADYHFTVAESYALEGESKKAIEAYKSALIYDSTATTVRTNLAKEYAKIGFMSEALEQAEAATEIDPKDIEARLVLGSLYSALKMYDLALSQYFVAMDLDPKDFEAPMYIGAIYAEQEKYDEAIKHFTQLAKSKKGTSKEYLFYYYIGRVHVERGEKFFGLAEKALAKSITLKPEYSGTTVALAKLLIVQRKNKAARRLLRSYQERFTPKHNIAKMLSDLYIDNDQYAQAYEQMEIMEGYDNQNQNLKLRMAILLIKQEKNEEAIFKLKSLLRLNPTSDKVRFYLGSVFEEVGKFDQAVEEYKRIPLNSVFHVDAVVRASHLLTKIEKDNEALDLLKEAVQQDLEDPTIYVFYASILDKMKKYEESIPVIEKGLARFPQNTQMMFFLGSVYDQLGKPRKTVEQMQKIIKLDSQHVQALNYLAYTYATLGENLNEAEQLVDRAIEIKPNDGYILDTKGWILFKKGEVARAIEYLEAAHRKMNNESVIAEHLGDAYYRYQLVDKARVMYQKAFKVEVDASKQQKIQAKIIATEQQLQKTQRMPASYKGK